MQVAGVTLARRAAVLGLAAALCTRRAAAHTRLVRSTPSDGAAVDRAPERVVLRFSSGIERRFSRLSLGSRDLVVDGDGDALVDQLSAKLPPLAAGSHVVKYDVVAADGHRTAGSINFTIRR